MEQDQSLEQSVLEVDDKSRIVLHMGGLIRVSVYSLSTTAPWRPSAPGESMET